ncbi:MAG: hypothetical protein ACOCP4_01755 [Candidatus Woesearchaeota archaeon]
MHDIANILSNIEQIFTSNTNFQILKDFERVIDELDVYVFANWEDGEISSGPIVERHWVTCTFMWPYNKMPDPSGGKRLLDYNCKVKYIETEIIEPREIRKPEDIRPGTKKGKLDSRPIWLVEIKIPKTLISDIWIGYQEKYYSSKDILDNDIINTDNTENTEDFEEFSGEENSPIGNQETGDSFESEPTSNQSGGI